MFEGIINFFKKIGKSEKEQVKSKDAAKERLHLVLMQDRANVSADFLDLMKQEIIEVIKKYINVDENAIDVRLTSKENSDGTTGAPALYANIPIVSIKDEVKSGMAREKNKVQVNKDEQNKEDKKEIKQEEKVQEKNETPKKEENKDIKEPVENEANNKEDKKEQQLNKEEKEQLSEEKPKEDEKSKVENEKQNS